MENTSGVVVKLDRGFPLVRCANGNLIRCEHATSLVKGNQMRAAIGDHVEVRVPEGHDKGVIDSIARRKTVFARKDPSERTSKQVLAANFDLVIVMEPIVQLNIRRIERELVLAHETEADVAIVLSKADLVNESQRVMVADTIGELTSKDVSVTVFSTYDKASVERIRKLVLPGEIAILVGRSGAGKSSLVNALVGSAMQNTAAVRKQDGRGRHTTVDRVLIDVPSGGAIVDMPGIRGLGLWEGDQGLDRAFADISSLAASCRFRDCTHGDEPGCAVQEAVRSGELASARLDSYRSLIQEIESVRLRRDEARRMRGEKASDRRKKRKR